MAAKRKQKPRKRLVLIIRRRKREEENVPPLGPSNLYVSSTATYMHLTWEHTGDTEEGFRIYRQMFDGPFEIIAEVIPDQTEFYDGNVEMGVVYTYYIVAYNAYGQSAPSNQMSNEILIGS